MTVDPDIDTRTMPNDPNAHVIARFPGQSGAVVRVIDLGMGPNAREHFAADCSGCLESTRTTLVTGLLDALSLSDARSWAVKHSGTCRALPQSDAAGSEHLTAAGELIERIREITFAPATGKPRTTLTGAEQSEVNTLNLTVSALIKMHEATR